MNVFNLLSARCAVKIKTTVRIAGCQFDDVRPYCLVILVDI
jgi:hypothetical protein